MPKLFEVKGPGLVLLDEFVSLRCGARDAALLSVEQRLVFISAISQAEAEA